jgi:hypothetical protein
MITLSPIKPASARSAAKAKQGPGADRINQAYEDFLNAAVPRGLIVGQLLIEQRHALLSSGAGWMNPHKAVGDQFAAWLEKNCPKITARTAYNWMKGAENTAKAIFPKRTDELVESGCIEIESEVIPISTVLLENGGSRFLELKQQYFDFAAEKTMKECIGGVFLDGNDPTSITRAHNGRTAKGAGGSGDRKAYAQFTATKLKHITTFVNSNMPDGERVQIIACTMAAQENWPKWYLKAIVEKAQKELKLSDEERAARKGELL